jgi:hypothetical protein
MGVPLPVPHPYGYRFRYENGRAALLIFFTLFFLHTLFFW